MAHTIDVTTLIDGPRNAVFHIYLVCDGVTGDLSDEVLIDPLDLVPNAGQTPSLTIEEITYDLSGFSARLEFEYLVGNTGAWTMAGDQSGHVCFNSFGGIKDRSGTLDGSGKLMISTKGFTSADDAGSIILKMRKS